MFIFIKQMPLFASLNQSMLIFGRRNSFMKWIIFDYLPENVDSFASLNYSLLLLGRRSFKKWVNFDLSPIRYLVSQCLLFHASRKLQNHIMTLFHSCFPNSK